MKTSWRGVFPAATTQFNDDFSINYAATQKVQQALIDDGVNGLIILGTCGENNSLLPEEKRKVLQGAVEVAKGRVPVIAGVSELDTAALHSQEHWLNCQSPWTSDADSQILSFLYRLDNNNFYRDNLSGAVHDG